jgi:hypothetical protein
VQANFWNPTGFPVQQVSRMEYGLAEGTVREPGRDAEAPGHRSTACWSTHPPTASAARPCPPKSPTLGFSHLQFKARLTAPGNQPIPVTSLSWPCSGV